MMRAAYLTQAINLAVVILMVPLLLRHLDANDYILWAIFTTFGAITQQFESAIQFVSVRDVARELHLGGLGALEGAIRRARRAYRKLAVLVLAVVLAVGLLYIHFLPGIRAGRHGDLEWAIFVVAYAVNYHFGVNTSILLGLAHVEWFSHITSLTRSLNFLTTYAMLKAGLALLGLSLSFALSVLVGSALYAIAAHRAQANLSDERGLPSPARDRPVASNVIRYTLYTLSSFVLFKGGVLLAASLFPASTVGPYILSLQAFTMLSALALVPIQVWLKRLVQAIAADDAKAMLTELVTTMATANGIFLAGTILMALLGNALLRLIGSSLSLAPAPQLAWISLAFYVELNILLLANFLVTKKNFEFVKIYLLSACAGIVLAAGLAWTTRHLILSLIVVPLVLQASISLPSIVRMACRELSTTPSGFFRHFRVVLASRL